MTKLFKIVLFSIFIIILGWLSFVFVWDIPAPVKTIEKNIPMDRFDVNN